MAAMEAAKSSKLGFHMPRKQSASPEANSDKVMGRTANKSRPSSQSRNKANQTAVNFKTSPTPKISSGKKEQSEFNPLKTY